MSRRPYSWEIDAGSNSESSMSSFEFNRAQNPSRRKKSRTRMSSFDSQRGPIPEKNGSFFWRTVIIMPFFFLLGIWLGQEMENLLPEGAKSTVCTLLNDKPAMCDQRKVPDTLFCKAAKYLPSFLVPSYCSEETTSEPTVVRTATVLETSTVVEAPTAYSTPTVAYSGEFDWNFVGDSFLPYEQLAKMKKYDTEINKLWSPAEEDSRRFGYELLKHDCYSSVEQEAEDYAKLVGRSFRWINTFQKQYDQAIKQALNTHDHLAPYMTTDKLKRAIWKKYANDQNAVPTTAINSGNNLLRHLGDLLDTSSKFKNNLEELGKAGKMPSQKEAAKTVKEYIQRHSDFHNFASENFLHVQKMVSHLVDVAERFKWIAQNIGHEELTAATQIEAIEQYSRLSQQGDAIVNICA